MYRNMHHATLLSVFLNLSIFFVLVYWCLNNSIIIVDKITFLNFSFFSTANSRCIRLCFLCNTKKNQFFFLKRIMDFFNAYIDLVTRSEFLDNCVFSNRHVLNLDEIMDLSVYHEDNMLVLCPADTERATMASYNGRLDVGDDPDEIDFMLEDAQHFVPTPNPENEDELATRLAAAVAQHVVGPAVRPLPEGEYEVARNYQSINFAIMFGSKLFINFTHF